ncbi:MAG: lamin tail domain-containing protein [Acidimicrobiia bacterium]
MKPTSLVVAVALLAAACSPTSTSSDGGPGSMVTVVRVLDGDSLIISIDGTEEEVRLLGINTPERDECFAPQARERTARLAAGQIRLDAGGRDQFGRLLGYVFTADATLINRQLIDEGLAIALSTDHPRRAEFKAGEETAFLNGLGRWEAAACGPADPARISITEMEPNAPGDDSQNPNGEWVELTNQGPALVRMTGWALQDESSSHRFAFPSDFVLPPAGQVRIFSGCGEDGPETLYWCGSGAIWSNGGDTAYLLDGSGNVVDRLAF